MDRAEALEDLSLLLFLSPLITSAAAAFLYAYPSLPLPPDAEIYLAVTKSPEVFLIGVVGVLAGLVLPVLATVPAKRRERLLRGAGGLQWVPVLSVVLAVVCAWSSQGLFVDASRVASLFLEGRYNLVFPLVVMFFSLAVNPSLQLVTVGRVLLGEGGAIVLALISPFILFGLWRSSAPPPVASGAALLVVGLAVVFPVLRRTRTAHP